MNGVRLQLARPAAGAIAGVAISEWLVEGAGPAWRTPVVAVVLAVAFVAAPGVDRWAGSGAPSAWALAAGLGIYVGVPETDHVVGVIAVLLVLCLAELAGRARVDWLVVCGLDAVLVWAAVRGAGARGGALVAGLAVLGLLVLADPVVRLPKRGPVEPTRWRVGALAALQLVFALGVARLGGVRTTTSEAVVVSGAAVVALIVAAWLVMTRGHDPGALG